MTQVLVDAIIYAAEIAIIAMGVALSFSILRFAEPEIPDIVYLEHLCGALYLDKSEDVEIYTKASHRLAVDAQTPEDTRKTLMAVRRNLR